ncbi:hypothetical protein TRFO_25923 [Tritrichomonas foetus]|uniref:Uncharacterized protein n=1 Tax=Tritrichomonas foetus TaxID=1144522 RepID=A0A1J4K8U7_9EUKA|nr:hypothetical protein TRFO_25923 [Tritrichomonas foetus]|eukprot:OHT06140.1 hypothetical protein TRFO_25923 [Tritrichomonas foetus]
MAESFQTFSLNLQRNGMTAEEILNAKTQLEKALTVNYHPIFQYIAQAHILNELAEWCFSTKHLEHPKFFEYSKTAINIFVAASSKNPDFLKNRILLNFFHTFLKEDDSLNHRLTGLFSRLYIDQIDNLSFLFEQFDDFGFLLVNRIDSLGIQDLLVEFVKKGKIPYQCNLILSELLCSLQNNDNACLTICRIYKGIPRNSPTYSQFTTQSTVGILVDAAISTPSCYTMSELISVVVDICYVCPSAKVFTEEQESLLLLTPENVTPLSIEAIDLFYNTFSSLFALFFVDERIHHKLMQKFQLITDDALAEVASIPGFIETLINAHEDGRWCPHCEKVALVLGASNLMVDELETEEWQIFYNDHFLHKLEILNNEYGGTTPDLLDNSDIFAMKQLTMAFKYSPSVAASMYNKRDEPEEVEVEDDLFEDDDNGEEYVIDI